jgi:hypothetical protein
MTNTADISSSTIMLHELHDSWSSLVVGDDVASLASMKEVKKSVHGVMVSCLHAAIWAILNLFS